jgi:hypothetical protein
MAHCVVSQQRSNAVAIRVRRTFNEGCLLNLIYGYALYFIGAPAAIQVASCCRSFCVISLTMPGGMACA